MGAAALLQDVVRHALLPELFPDPLDEALGLGVEVELDGIGHQPACRPLSQPLRESFPLTVAVIFARAAKSPRSKAWLISRIRVLRASYSSPLPDWSGCVSLTRLRCR